MPDLEKQAAAFLQRLGFALQAFPHSIGFCGNQKSLDWQGQLDA
jgi:hypothetical protein